MAEHTPKKDASKEKILDALTSAEVPKLYANGFAVGLSNADTYIVLQLNQRPLTVVHLSYTLAKTLHQKLGRMIGEFEAKSEQPILITDDVEKLF